MATRRYLYLAGGIWASVMAAITGLNWLVDPYDLFPSPKLNGFNIEKPEADTRQRLHKAYGVSRVSPEVVLLGSSRGLALSTHHEAWSGKKVYNLALASTSTKELFRYLQHANRNNSVKEVVWGLDWFGYSDHIGNTDYADARLRVNVYGDPRAFNLAQYGRDILPSLWSLDAIGASFATLKGQPAIEDRVTWALQRDHARVARNGGNAAMFEDFERHTAMDSPLTPPPPSRTRGVDGPGAQTWRDILRYAYAHSIELRLFISPEHARLFEIWRLTGLWPEIELWQNELVRVLDEEAKRAGQPAFRLWDFGGYNSVTLEAVPALGDTTRQMRWYWEDSHYTEALSLVILDRLYGRSHPERPPIADFGLEINHGNIDRHWQGLRANAEEFSRRLPEVERHLQEIVRNAAEFKQRR